MKLLQTYISPRHRGFSLLAALVGMGLMALAVVLSYPGYKRSRTTEKVPSLRN